MSEQEQFAVTADPADEVPAKGPEGSSALLTGLGKGQQDPAVSTPEEISSETIVEVTTSTEEAVVVAAQPPTTTAALPSTPPGDVAPTATSTSSSGAVAGETSSASAASGEQSTTTLSSQNPLLPPKVCQDVRVDNWGNYCLQRLQLMYDRGDFCDLTMQFQANQLLKVHRVVVNLCTEYFTNLERLFGLTDGVLVLPKEIDYQAMVIIVKFFYTGKLEIRGNLFNEVYKTVKLMNITILVKLLEAHTKKNTVPIKKEARPIIMKKSSMDIGRSLSKPGSAVGGPVKLGGATALAIQGAKGTKTLQVTTPGIKLPPGVKTKTVLARVQSQPVRLGQHGSVKGVAQKKLPIWKERKFTPSSCLEATPSEMVKIKEEPPKPTRFEWGDPDEESDPFLSPPVISHTLLEKQKTNVSSGTKKAEDIFDAVKSHSLGKRDNSESSLEEPSSKLLKGQIFETTETEPEFISGDCLSDAASTSTESPFSSPTKTPSILKPAIKSQSKSANFVSQTSSNRESSTPKSVRFAQDVEKENTSETTVPIINSNEDVTTSHSKIISEVLKKFPDLVKDKQNIKLKIVQKGSEMANPKDKSKVSYIVLKSTSSPETVGSVLKKQGQVTTNKSFWEGEKEKKPSGAENTTGPWLCGPCGGSEETPMEFDTYYQYRRHLVEIHNERIDARICEHCGQKASKRNLLLYHMYTKHAIPPPKNIHFPSCDRCDYVALSVALLNKHKLTHDSSKEYCCNICNASFKSSGALQGHMAANLHRNKDTKVYECPYCKKPFVRNINLKAHIRALHKEIARVEEMDDPRLPHDESITSRNQNSLSVKKRQFPAILSSRSVPLEILPGHHEGPPVSLVTPDGHTIEILHGLDPNTVSVPMTIVPSSEAEAMTNVANSIAASLGLEGQGVHGSTEFITSDGTQAVYIMDNSQPAVEVDMSTMALPEGTMIYDGSEDSNHQEPFIVQDIHGNQFRKMTGIDENGKPVIFFQLSEESPQIPAMLEGGLQNVSSDSGQPSQVLLTAAGAPDDSVYGMIHGDESQGQVVITSLANSLEPTQLEMSSDGGARVEFQHGEAEVQELHIVLDSNNAGAAADETAASSESRAANTQLINQESAEHFEQVIGEGQQQECSENDQQQSSSSSAVGEIVREQQQSETSATIALQEEVVNNDEKEGSAESMESRQTEQADSGIIVMGASGEEVSEAAVVAAVESSSSTKSPSEPMLNQDDELSRETGDMQIVEDVSSDALMVDDDENDK